MRLPVFCIALFTSLSMLMAGCSPPPLNDMTGDIQTIIADYEGATVAVSILDASKGFELHMDADRLFHAASTMKVPVLIELYRQAESGRFSLSDEVLLKNEFRSIVDGSLFQIEDDSDDAIYEQLGTPMALEQLAYNMITVSSNLATNLLIDFLSADSVQTTSERLGTTHMQTIRGVEDLKAFDLGMSNKATSRDLAHLMELLRTGTAVSVESDAAMREILNNQVFQTMIPSGLPAGVRAAHKTGSITAIHHDAAIIYPPDSEPFVLVIMIQGLQDHEASSLLGSEITRYVYKNLRGDA
ncbi:MAG: serine hydrolase [Bacteroidetes Order II. Incertae sedis bacterium]|jgi:beta-lactamase class A|nr:serine hydrolase [Bacteroidetes Order II. bacterium]MBT4052529.1 serine hydrolase [Bacteroidetes Order II. bacterium]MBT4601635.1 serine hydrolase [Bacteroidetes Order II. bacterium]MBT5249965.1 serine hydrolase [Bacteroidetes Order II. bacterium]MBT6200621.1 serine hydrolase [Bacteroidetes Order II. bacterium]